MLWGHSIFRFEISQLWRFVLVIQLARHYDVSFDKHVIADFLICVVTPLKDQSAHYWCWLQHVPTFADRLQPSS
jgi:hypothetical protein